MKVLVAVDLTEPVSWTEAVQKLIERLDAEMLVLHVRPDEETLLGSKMAPAGGLSGIPSYGYYDPALIDELETAEENVFQSFLIRHFKKPVQVSSRKGDPAVVIVEDAEKYDVDLIVLGKRPYSRLEKLLVGSVASSVIKKTQRPILLMPVEVPPENT